MDYWSLPETYVEMLDAIASGENWRREELAYCVTKIPHDILRALAQDEDWNIRYACAARPGSIPSDVVDILIHDSRAEVRIRLARRLDLPDGHDPIVET